MLIDRDAAPSDPVEGVIAMTAINRSKPILVFLANGVQGAAVVRALLRHRFKVRALVRDRLRASLPHTPDLECVEGDLHNPESLHAASRNVEHAVLQIPIGPIDEMMAQASNAVAALAKEQVRSLVLKLASASRPAPCQEPSFVANAELEKIVRRSRLPFCVVRPTMYLDNLLKPSARKDIVAHGIFAPPIRATQRIAWTSADDCADAAVRLLSNSVDGGDYRIAGPENLTGDELAERISAGLGRTVTYRAQPIGDFEHDVDLAMGAGVGRRVASKFRYFSEHADEAEEILAKPFDVNSSPKGFKPTSVENWVRSHRAALLDDQ